jgi:hypothetical protein
VDVYAKKFACHALYNYASDQLVNKFSLSSAAPSALPVHCNPIPTLRSGLLSAGPSALPATDRLRSNRYCKTRREAPEENSPELKLGVLTVDTNPDICGFTR